MTWNFYYRIREQSRAFTVPVTSTQAWCAVVKKTWVRPVAVDSSQSIRSLLLRTCPRPIPRAPPPMPSEAELEAMTVKQLKAFLAGHLRVSSAGCLEKSELVKLAKVGRARALPLES